MLFQATLGKAIYFSELITNGILMITGLLVNIKNVAINTILVELKKKNRNSSPKSRCTKIIVLSVKLQEIK